MTDKHKEKLENLPKFDKSQRSTFRYWWNHWKAFQWVAMDCGVWEPRYIFHDWYKPWLRLVLPYEKVQRIHRYHSKHHLEWAAGHDREKVDWYGMIVDWECSRFTKEKSPYPARQAMEIEIEKHPGYEVWLREYMEPKLRELGL